MLRNLAPLVLVTALVSGLSPAVGADPGSTRVALREGSWMFNGRVTNPDSAVEGLLMNVRMVNAVFEDRNKPEFDPEANTDRFIARIPDYAAHGVNAFTVCLHGGMPGYEGAVNSAFEWDGALRRAYLARVERLIRACDRHGVAVILGLYYQRQSVILRDETAVRAGVANAARWVRERGFSNVLLEIANEYPHTGFVHALIRDLKGQAGLIRLAKATAPGLLVSASGYGDGRVHREVAEAADFLLPHWNGTSVEQIPERIAALRQYGKPIVCNEDDKTGTNAVAALLASVENGASYGLMLKDRNQTFPFRFDGGTDDPVFYAQLRTLATPRRPTAAPGRRDPAPRSHPQLPTLNPPPGLNTTATVERWDTCERTLRAARTCANPFQDVQVTARFDHTSGRTITVDGFHDGGQIWKIRFMPTELGRWTYTTTSLDQGLNGQTGTIECVPRVKPYLRGPLGVQGHHFRHTDGTPCFLSAVSGGVVGFSLPTKEDWALIYRRVAKAENQNAIPDR